MPDLCIMPDFLISYTHLVKILIKMQTDTKDLTAWEYSIAYWCI